MKLIVNFQNFANVPKKKDCVDINASCEEVNLDCKDVNWGCRDANSVSEDVNATELIHMALMTGFGIIRPASVNTTLLTNSTAALAQAPTQIYQQHSCACTSTHTNIPTAQAPTQIYQQHSCAGTSTQTNIPTAELCLHKHPHKCTNSTAALAQAPTQTF